MKSILNQLEIKLNEGQVDGTARLQGATPCSESIRKSIGTQFQFDSVHFKRGSKPDVDPFHFGVLSSVSTDFPRSRLKGLDSSVTETTRCTKSAPRLELQGELSSSARVTSRAIEWNDARRNSEHRSKSPQTVLDRTHTCVERNNKRDTAGGLSGRQTHIWYGRS